PAGSRRLLENRDLVPEPRQLVRRAVSRGARSDDRDLLAVGRAGFHDVARQRLPEIAEEPLDGADRDRLVVLAAVARLFARVIADAARDRRERHVFLDERVGVAILPGLNEIQICLNLFVGYAGVVA